MAIPATLAKVGMAIPAAAIRRLSAAVDTDPGSNPLASASWLCTAPSETSRAFILVTKACDEPESQTASTVAASLAERTRRASSSCSSVSVSPVCSGMLVSSLARSMPNWAASSGVMVTVGPLLPRATGWSRSTTNTVVILVSEAMGTGTSGPDWSA